MIYKYYIVLYVLMLIAFSGFSGAPVQGQGRLRSLRRHAGRAPRGVAGAAESEATGAGEAAAIGRPEAPKGLQKALKELNRAL